MHIFFIRNCQCFKKLSVPSISSERFTTEIPLQDQHAWELSCITTGFVRSMRNSRETTPIKKKKKEKKKSHQQLMECSQVQLVRVPIAFYAFFPLTVKSSGITFKLQNLIYQQAQPMPARSAPEWALIAFGFEQAPFSLVTPQGRVFWKYSPSFVRGMYLTTVLTAICLQ